MSPQTLPVPHAIIGLKAHTMVMDYPIGKSASYAPAMVKVDGESAPNQIGNIWASVIEDARAASTTKWIDPTKARTIAQGVFDRHADLFRRLAQ